MQRQQVKYEKLGQQELKQFKKSPAYFLRVKAQVNSIKNQIDKRTYHGEEYWA